MSSQPHVVLPWVVRRIRLPLLSPRCVHCQPEPATAGQGSFRVTANRNLLDVWLPVRCLSCGQTSKPTVYERAASRSSGPAAALDDYQAGDPELAASRLPDQRNRFILDWKAAWRLDTAPAWLAEIWPAKVEVGLEDPVPLRPQRLIAQGPGLSRNQVRRPAKYAIPLRRPASTGFSFTVTARAYQRRRGRRT